MLYRALLRPFRTREPVAVVTEGGAPLALGFGIASLQDAGTCGGGDRGRRYPAPGWWIGPFQWTGLGWPLSARTWAVGVERLLETEASRGDGMGGGVSRQGHFNVASDFNRSSAWRANSIPSPPYPALLIPPPAAVSSVVEPIVAVSSVLDGSSVWRRSGSMGA